MSPTGATAGTSIRPSRRPRSILDRGLLGILGAVVAVALVRGIASVVVADIDAFAPLAWSALVGAAIVAATAATLAYIVLVQAVAEPEQWFLALAITVLTLSFVPLLTIAPDIEGATPALIAVLGAMHLVVAVVVVVALVGYTLTPRAGADRRSDPRE